MKRMMQGLILAGSLMVGGAALAQGSTQGQPGRDKGTQATRPVSKEGMVEHMGFMVPADQKAFLERLHHINQQEIQLGKLAQQNAQSQDVKSFADTMVKEHTAADEKLMSYAQQKGFKLSTPKPMNEMERKHMAASKAALEVLQTMKGRPFEAYFLAAMVGEHDLALGKVLAAQQTLTSADVAPMLQQHAQIIAQHRQQAHELLGRIGPGAAVGVGGAGDMNQGLEQEKEMPRDDMGISGEGEPRKGKSPSDKNTLDPGNQKRY